jgi:hypothetical protein
MPMITTTIISSMSVKPFEFLMTPNLLLLDPGWARFELGRNE